MSTVAIALLCFAVGLFVGAMANLTILILFASDETMKILTDLRARHRLQ